MANKTSHYNGAKKPPKKCKCDTPKKKKKPPVKHNGRTKYA